MSKMKLPYETATSGHGALIEAQRMLAAFGCESFGTGVDAAKGVTIIHFTWRDKQVRYEASWAGYAAVWKKRNPLTARSRMTPQEYDKRAYSQAQVAVCSILRDWVKSQITLVECQVASFEEVFLPYMVLASGERIIDKVSQLKLE